MPLYAARCISLQATERNPALLLALGLASQAEGRRFAATQSRALGQLGWPANPVSRSKYSQCPRSFRTRAFLLGVGPETVGARVGPDEESPSSGPGTDSSKRGKLPSSQSLGERPGSSEWMQRGPYAVV